MFKSKIGLFLFTIALSISSTTSIYAVENNPLDEIKTKAETNTEKQNSSNSDVLFNNFQTSFKQEKTTLNVVQSQYLSNRESTLNEISNTISQYVLVDGSEEPIFIYYDMGEVPLAKVYDKYLCELIDIQENEETNEKFYHVYVNSILEYDEKDIEEQDIETFNERKVEGYIPIDNSTTYDNFKYDLYDYLLENNLLDSSTPIKEYFYENEKDILKAFGSNCIYKVYKYTSDYIYKDDYRYMTQKDENELRSDIVGFALQYVGNDYVWGGTSLENGADCSGFVMKVYENYDFSLYRVAQSQRKCGDFIKEKELKPGDLIFYGDGTEIEHVTIYMGDEKIVHAANTKDGIITSKVHYWNVLGFTNVLVPHEIEIEYSIEEK